MAVTTVLGIALEGVYAAGLPLTKVFDPTVFGDVLDTRYGKVALVRLALLVVAFPLLRLLLHRRTMGRSTPCARGGWSPPASSASGSR